ncbi:MAG: rhomboid family intramembrane serine protease, partial [Thermodesulfobacteriota bacterium]|nr:rhomboid family intramembrane serine protease [Thermodesulfobacteriota bacterium]
MIPIRDTVRSETYPIINYVLIGLNILAFFVEQSLGQNLNEFVFTYGLVPARYSVPQISAHFTTAQQVIAFLTFMFIHGGFFHLLGNMWFLYIFGDNVEDRLGHFRYLAFYLLCGLASGISHLFLNWTSQIPTIGASGAIAGVMGAYFILYPRAKVLTLVPIFFFIQFI